MANTAIILGKSGTGKSTGIKGLDPATTIVNNVLRKKLPFKGSAGMYSSEKRNLFNVDTYDEIIDLLEAIAEQAPHIRNVVLDDAIYIMRKEYFKKANEAGYNKFTVLAQHFQQIINCIEHLPDRLNVFLIMHSEEIYSDRAIIGYKTATIGQMLENQYNPMETVPIILYSDVQYDAKGTPSYGFYTGRTMKGNIEIPAKSPEGMFEEKFIPNDLGMVAKAMEEYYG